jgi:UDP-N-acetylmuramoyl-L-alanyl-D-glutamate--2,6-diaminopimelate ligase
MGAVAARLADYVIVTSDNPRSEDPEEIIGQILEGVLAARPGGADVVTADRTDAIAAGLAEAKPGDVFVIAGKGHEQGQEFADRTIDFDDRVVARAGLADLGWDDAP